VAKLWTSPCAAISTSSIDPARALQLVKRALTLGVLLLLVASCKDRAAARARALDEQEFARASARQPAGDGVDHSLPGVIVVLGSSTAAGTGPSDPKNAWVERYRAYLAKQFPRFTLTNLAAGGQTTYHVQASDFSPPRGRPAPVRDKNISAALALGPDAIIVNLPSNDAAASIPLAEQLANYERIATLARAARALLWVSTSQPRHFDSDAQKLLLSGARDAIARQFAPRALDFWTPFAERTPDIAERYDAGDGVHMNDAAHARLTTIVLAARIPETVLLTR
jgi:lysophospholipase L1-like esterase